MEAIIFCELEQVELRVDICPIACMYRAANGTCAHNALTDDQVDVATLSKVNGKKVYKLKTMGAAAKQLIEIGLAIDSYAEYIKETVPKIDRSNINAESDADGRANVVNTSEGSSGVTNRLKNLFNLTDYQRREFWSEDRFSKWSKRMETQVTLRDMRQALISI